MSDIHRATQAARRRAAEGSNHSVFPRYKIVYHNVLIVMTIKTKHFQFQTHINTLGMGQNNVMHNPIRTYTLTEVNACVWLLPTVLHYADIPY